MTFRRIRRQARIDVAVTGHLRQPMTARQLKNDTVSHLAWLPADPSERLRTRLGEVWIDVQRNHEAADRYNVIAMQEACFMFYTCQQGTSAEGVAQIINHALPPAFTRNGLAGFHWSRERAKPGYLEFIIECFQFFRIGLEVQP